MTMEMLGFTLRMAEGERDLHEAAALRALAYGHHLPAMAVALAQPDAIDRQRGTVVLLARDKATGQAIGTARIVANRAQPLQIEHSFPLQARFDGTTCAEVTRLAVRPGAEPRVKLMLMKACWRHALDAGIDWLVIGARCEALIRMYRRLGFVHLLPDGETVPLAHAGHLPHRVLALDIPGAEAAWRRGAHPLYPLMVQTEHPDLQLGAAVAVEPLAA